MVEKISCAECGKEMSCINNRHLSSHNMTADEYRKKYPTALMRTTEVADRLSKRSIESNKDRVGKSRSEAEIRAIRVGVSKRPSRKGMSLGHLSEETKLKISETKKRMYSEGLIVPPTLGQKLSEERKRKISSSVHSFMEIKYADHWAAKQRENSLKEHNRKVSKIISHSKLLERVSLAGLSLVAEDGDVFSLKCNICGYCFNRTKQNFQPSKFDTKICNQCFPLSKQSIGETQVADFVKSIIPDTVITSDWETISPFELDIFVPSHGIAIEYCGLYQMRRENPRLFRAWDESRLFTSILH